MNDDQQSKCLAQIPLIRRLIKQRNAPGALFALRSLANMVEHHLNDPSPVTLVGKPKDQADE